MNATSQTSQAEPAAAGDRAAQFDSLYLRRADPPGFAREMVEENHRLLRALIPAGARVLDIGCGSGDSLAAVEPALGVGVDLSPVVIEEARRRHPGLTFLAADAEAPLDLAAIAGDAPFDAVLLNLAIGDLQDVWKTLRHARAHCGPGTRVIITYYNFVWSPAIKLTTWMGLRRGWPEQNWFSLEDIQTMLALNGFETIEIGTRTLCPVSIPLLARFANRWLAGLPGMGRLNLWTYCVGRLPAPEIERAPRELTVSVIIPTRNERGNIQGAVDRTPEMGKHTELIFVDGDSSDGTVEEIERLIAENPARDIKLIHQIPRGPERGGQSKDAKMLKLGKGDAVRKGFAAATGDVLMILDSDLTVPPEDMDKFYLAIAEDRAEFINGNRLSYPMEDQAMRFLNLVANRVFGMLFTWLLGQRVKDTLCGTKVLSRDAYAQIAAGRAHFGDFDPFGDFDLLFGAARRRLKIIDLPVRYRAREYGEIKIERFKHGWLLLKMCVFAFRRFKLE